MYERDLIFYLEIVLSTYIILRCSCDETRYAVPPHNVNDSGHCAVLKKHFDESNEPRYCRQLRIYDKVADLVILSTSRAPSLATAAILAATLRHRYGYENVITAIDNRKLSEVASRLPKIGSEFEKKANRTQMYIHVDADWEENSAAPQDCTTDADFCGIGGPRLQPMGVAKALNLKLYSVLESGSMNDSLCQNRQMLNFYTNENATRLCGFLVHDKSNASTCIKLVTLADVPLQDIKLNKTDVKFCYEAISERAILSEKVNNATESFLFIDYEMWKEDSRVQSVLLPADIKAHETKVSFRIGDVKIFRQFAGKVVKILSNLNPDPFDLREVLEINATTRNIDEAACAWIKSNLTKFYTWSNASDPELMIPVFICNNDPDYYEYINLINELKDLQKLNYVITVGKINCSDTSGVAHLIERYTRGRSWQHLASIISLGAGGVEGARAADAEQTYLLLYDTPASRTRLNTAARTSTGSLKHLANAYKLFIKNMGWRRLGIISERSPLAEDFTKELSNGNIVHKEVVLQQNNLQAITTALKTLKDADARIFFINTRAEIAKAIVCEASRFGMTEAAGYAWIVREWRPDNCTRHLRVFTISYWWRGGNASWGNSERFPGLLERLSTIWKGRPWPLSAAPLADALLIAQYGIAALSYKDHCDLHAKSTRRLLSNRLHGQVTGPGLMQGLKLHNHALSQPFIYINSWKGNHIDLLYVWRASDDGNINIVKDILKAYPNGNPPRDGTKCVILSTRDKFSAKCLDGTIICSVLVLILMPIVLLLAKRQRLKRLQRRDKEMQVRLMARCEKTATALAGYLVDRSALELSDEIGTGHFGKVRGGMLRLPNQKPIAVAVKELKNDAGPAQEAEFLREASALASLDHPHIVKLTGVCAADGPPLLLMERAYFKDLLGYLRERRHLAEMHEKDSCEDDNTCVCDPEANHVTPVELTRMAREAADALAYLASQKLVHRDVRAGNCLVDSRRGLKLADFGLARFVGAKASKEENSFASDYKYICRRPGVFPVCWMAPECFEHCEFTYASDVWALGVLILEIATFGAKPFGDMTATRANRVIRFIRAGGKPPLPRNIFYHTFEVTEMCWHAKPSLRASASEISAYLSQHPSGVRAALLPPPRVVAPPAPPSIALDSGIGEREDSWSINTYLKVSTW